MASLKEVEDQAHDAQDFHFKRKVKRQPPP
jgi:hypothetical protein